MEKLLELQLNFNTAVDLAKLLYMLDLVEHTGRPFGPVPFSKRMNRDPNSKAIMDRAIELYVEATE